MEAYADNEEAREVSESFDLLIVMPVYEDWPALGKLLLQVDREPALQDLSVGVLVVNDSVARCELDHLDTTSLQLIQQIEIVNLERNLGHQRAITTGLSYLYHRYDTKNIVVMDSDGEDRPEDIKLLLRQSEEAPGELIFAGREKRSESHIFRAFYWLYKQTFKLLTSHTITFGNFCLIPSSRLKNLMLTSEIWNHFSAGIIKSRIPYSVIPTERGVRLEGESTMRFSSLVMHGLSAISVFMETVAVRLVLFSLALIILTVLSGIAVVMIKYSTEMAIPGWSSNILMGLSILFMQGLLISTLLTFVIFPLRNLRNFIPAHDCASYISGTELFFKK